MSGILNKSHVCECGSPKNWRRQWCNDCFECLTKSERITWINHTGELARIANVLQGRINERTLGQPSRKSGELQSGGDSPNLEP